MPEKKLVALSPRLPWESLWGAYKKHAKEDLDRRRALRCLGPTVKGIGPADESTSMLAPEHVYQDQGPYFSC